MSCAVRAQDLPELEETVVSGALLSDKYSLQDIMQEVFAHREELARQLTSCSDKCHGYPANEEVQAEELGERRVFVLGLGPDVVEVKRSKDGTKNSIAIL